MSEYDVLKLRIAQLEKRTARLTRILLSVGLMLLASVIMAWSNYAGGRQAYFGEFWASSDDAVVSHEGKFSANAEYVNLTLGEPGGDKTTGFYVVPGLDMGFSSKNNESYIAMYDVNQKPRLILGLTQSEGPIIRMLDENGRIIWAAPSM